jgi:hypothetical protein
MASPRWEAGNQPSTSRPLAACTDALPAPASSSHSPVATGVPASAAPVMAVAAVPSPALSTRRSP